MAMLMHKNWTVKFPYLVVVLNSEITTRCLGYVPCHKQCPYMIRVGVFYDWPIINYYNNNNETTSPGMWECTNSVV